MHGDDYVTVGPLEQLQWLRTQLEKRFEMKTTDVGHSHGDGIETEGKILNRIVRATVDRWQYE